MTQLEHKKPILTRARRVVVKIGSQILSSKDGIEEGRLRGLVRELAELHGQASAKSWSSVRARWRRG